MTSINGESSVAAKQRGAVEEIISKRLKTLTKKIVRIKSYNTTTLNADQQAAIASLPPLEAVAKELEELIKPGGPIETTELAQAGQIREMREEMLVRQEEENGVRMGEFKRELVAHLGSFLTIHESLSKEGVREEMGSEEVHRIKEIYEDLKSGDVAALDRIGEFNKNTPYTPSEGTSDGASQIDYDHDHNETPSQVYTQSEHTPGSAPINFLQQDEVEWETPKTVDWSDEVDDGGLIFGDVNGEKEGLASGQEVEKKEEKKKEEEIPILEPVLPMESKPSTDKTSTQPPSASSDKRQKKRGPSKPKIPQSKSQSQSNTNSKSTEQVEKKKTQGPRHHNLPPKPLDDGFEQVVRKQATRGRGGARGGVGRGRGNGSGRGRGGGGSNGAVINGNGDGK